LSTEKLQIWITSKASPDWFAYVKRLSANDTGASGGHGSGIYIPSTVTERVFPSLLDRDTHNPDYLFKAQVDSHDLEIQELRAIYYNSKFSENRANGRDEHRITRWKQGVDYAPLQDPENTGALAIFAFQVDLSGTGIEQMSVWVCRCVEEEDYIEGLVGEVLPAASLFKPLNELFGGVAQLPLFQEVDLELPNEWVAVFPSGQAIIDFVVEQFAFSDLDPDRRLLKRREQEYVVFRMIEDLHALPLIRSGFNSVEDFVTLANSISNRRKSRAGRSLELHLEKIFIEEGLSGFDTQVTTEGNKKPDFLFPSVDAYKNTQFPDTKLNMLAVKTTLKDRWRQILNEANRIPDKYLFTLQEGVSENQFKEMQAEGVSLVVPKALIRKYPEAVRGGLTSLEEFISHIRKVSETR